MCWQNVSPLSKWKPRYLMVFVAMISWFWTFSLFTMFLVLIFVSTMLSVLVGFIFTKIWDQRFVYMTVQLSIRVFCWSGGFKHTGVIGVQMRRKYRALGHARFRNVRSCYVIVDFYVKVSFVKVWLNGFYNVNGKVIHVHFVYNPSVQTVSKAFAMSRATSTVCLLEFIASFARCAMRVICATVLCPDLKPYWTFGVIFMSCSMFFSLVSKIISTVLARPFNRAMGR